MLGQIASSGCSDSLESSANSILTWVPLTKTGVSQTRSNFLLLACKGFLTCFVRLCLFSPVTYVLVGIPLSGARQKLPKLSLGRIAKFPGWEPWVNPCHRIKTLILGLGFLELASSCLLSTGDCFLLQVTLMGFIALQRISHPTWKRKLQIIYVNIQSFRG